MCMVCVCSPQLYVTFWALSMFDLYVPTERYEQELNKLKLQLAQLEDNKDMVGPFSDISAWHIVL